MLNFFVYEHDNKHLNNLKISLNKEMFSLSVDCKLNLFDKYDNKLKDAIDKPIVNKVYLIEISESNDIGLKIAKDIRKKDCESIIMFLMCNKSLIHKVSSENLNYFTYLLKCENYEGKFTTIIKDLLKYCCKNSFLTFKENNEYYSIPLNSILYVTKNVKNRKTIIQTDTEKYEIRDSLQEVEKRLTLFVKTHRSCLVNFKRIKKYDQEKNIIYFDADFSIDLVSKKYKSTFIKFFIY